MTKKMMIQRNKMEKMMMMPVKKTMIKKIKIAEKREKAEDIVFPCKYHPCMLFQFVYMQVWIF